jgi:hypothetical protein
MKKYQKPLLEVLELEADKALAAVIQSEPTVEDNEDDDDLSVG